MDDTENRRLALCKRYGADYRPPAPESRLGIALQTLNQVPINGMRVRLEGGTCGWYIWAGGEPGDADDFYQPLCVRHLDDHCVVALDYLALPPGWRFQADHHGYEEVWFDETLLRA